LEGRQGGDICVLVRDHVDGRRVIRLMEKAGIPAVPAATQEPGYQEAVIVQTFHGSKGLEYPVVIMPFMDEGRFPNSKRLKRDRANLMADLKKARASSQVLAGLRKSRRGRLTRLWWVLLSAYLPSGELPKAPGLLARVARALFMAAEATWVRLWAGDIERSLVLREARARAFDDEILRVRPQALRTEALEEAASAWGDEARQTLAEERRLCYVAITRAQDRWVAIARSRGAASPFIANLPEDVVEWVGHEHNAEDGFKGF